MKKTITLFSFLFLNLGILFSQDFDWAKTIISDGNDEFQAVEIDEDGNIFTLGNFSNTAILTGVTLNAVGNSNIFLAKYNPEGDLIWVKTIDGGIARGLDLDIDVEGNLILVGTFEFAIDFGTETITSGEGTNIFIAKLDSAGELIWVRNSTHSENITAQGFRVKSDNNGDIIIVGATVNFQNSTTATVNFDGIEITNNGFFDALIVKYSKDGEFLWYDTAGNTGPDLAYDVDIDDNNNIYVTGIFALEVVFGGTDTLSSASLGQEDIFILKYRPNGNIAWLKQSTTPVFARGENIGVYEDHVFLAGYFLISMEFGGESIAPPDTSVYCYVSKIDTLGNVVYTRPYARSLNFMGTKNLDFDENGNPYIAGRYQGEGITEDSLILSNLPNAESFMLTKHDNATGEILKVWNGGGTNGTQIEDVAIKHSGEIYFGGSTFAPDFTFQDTTLSFMETNPGSSFNGFLIKIFDEDFVNVFTPELLDDIIAYPNPVVDILTIDMGKERESMNVQVFDITGRRLLETNFYNQQKIEFQTDAWGQGIYFLKIRMGKHFVTIKIMK